MVEDAPPKMSPFWNQKSRASSSKHSGWRLKTSVALTDSGESTKIGSGLSSPSAMAVER